MVRPSAPCWIPIALALVTCHREGSSGDATTGAAATGAIEFETEPILQGTGLADSVGEPGGHQPEPQPRTVVVSMGDEEVTWEDIRQAFARSLLMTGRPLDELASRPFAPDGFLLWQLGEQVLADRRLLSEGGDRGLLPGQEEIVRVWQNHPQLRVYAALPRSDLEDQLHSYLGLEIEDLLHLVTTEIVYQRWLDRVTASIGEEDLRAHHGYLNHTIDLDVVEIPNLPTSREIEQFLAAPPQPDWVRHFYDQHPAWFMQPESADVRIVRIRIPVDASVGEVERARERIDRLRASVAQGEDMVPISRQDSEDPARDSGGLWYRVVRPQFPPAFEIPDGELSPVQQDEHGFFFFRVETRYPATLRPLDHLLEREIAASYLSHHVMLPEPMAAAERVVAGLQAGREASQLLGDRSVRHRRLEHIRREPDGMIPGIGVSPELQAAIFALTEQDPVVDRPCFINGSFFGVRLVERLQPGEEDFLAERDQVEEEYRAYLRAVAWDDFWSRCKAEQPLVLRWPSPVDPDRKEP